MFRGKSQKAVDFSGAFIRYAKSRNAVDAVLYAVSVFLQKGPPVFEAMSRMRLFAVISCGEFHPSPRRSPETTLLIASRLLIASIKTRLLLSYNSCKHITPHTKKAYVLIELFMSSSSIKKHILLNHECKYLVFPEDIPF